MRAAVRAGGEGPLDCVGDLVDEAGSEDHLHRLVLDDAEHTVDGLVAALVAHRSALATGTPR